MIFLRKLIALTMLFLFSITISGCNKEHDKVEIAATTLPVYEFTAALCQDTDIDVTCLITESVSCLHDYSLRVNQMRSIENADYIVVSGAGLEHFMYDFLPAEKVIDSSIGIELLCIDHENEHSDNDHSHRVDPHIWLSPENAKKMADNIYNNLIAVYPEFSQSFSNNKAKIDKQFDKLIEYANINLANLSCREIVTFHDGFAYMAQNFNISIVHTIEEEAGSEASAATIIQLTNIIRKHGIPAIFTEKNGSDASAKLIAAETDVKLYSLDMALSGDSYFNAMYHNINVLKEALK